MKAKDRRRNTRQWRHINDGGRVFLPQSRMRHIRWEESLMHAYAKRKGASVTSFRHLDCHCGSVECLGVPTPIASPSPV